MPPIQRAQGQAHGAGHDVGVRTVGRFLGLNPLGGDNTAFIDSVRLNLVTS